MLFADDLVLSADDRLKLEQELEKWREVMESAGLKLSRSKPPAGETGDIMMKEYNLKARAKTTEM